MKFFDPFAVTTVTGDRLPHWFQSGATLFVTFRLADSLPREKLKSLREERQRWCEEHPEPWDEATERKYHLRFSAKIDRWLDEGAGSCLFADPSKSKIVMDALLHFDGQRYIVHSAVVMPNHVHVLFTLQRDQSLDRLIHSWESFTAHKLGSSSLWQRDYFDRIIRDADHFCNVRAYIRNNPGKAKLREDDYRLHEAPVEWL
jgi:putative transposase